MRLVIGTRGSKLATTQSGMVADQLRAHGHEVSLEIIVTRGDREQDKAVPLLGGKGLFTAELEDALREGRIHLAVHSLKDLPTEDAPGLVVAAVPAREDHRDALVSGGAKLANLPAGARIGTLSLRRRALLREMRPDLELVDLRGNVDTRLRKVADGEMDAVVLAAAGLKRLGRADAITEYLDLLPAPAQGALGIQAHGENTEVLAAVEAIHDETAALCAAAERELLARLEGGCSVPVGALAERTRDGLRLRGVVASPDGTRVLRTEVKGADATEVAARATEELLAQGAKEILDAAR